jgi:hypothetical protein
MNVVLVHPIHGAKVAIDATEIENDELAGWTRYEPVTPVEDSAPAEPAEPAELAVDTPVRRKYSRKTPAPVVEQSDKIPEFLETVSDPIKGE